MINKPSIQLKAAFLLVAFSLNTIVGFACAIGIDMSFNTPHHHNEEATEATIHIHADGKKHVHNEKKDKHKHDKSHHNKSEVNKESNEGDNCCNEKVTKFVQLDKFVPQALNIGNPVFFTPFISSFYNIELLHRDNITKDIKYFVRSYHPPIPDIRIAIRSFQI